MNEPNNENDVKFSAGEYVMPVPKMRRVVFMERREWERLKRMISNSAMPSSWYDVTIGGGITATLSFVGFGVTISSNSAVLYVTAFFIALLTGVFIFFKSREEKTSNYSKKEIANYIDEIDIENSGEESASTVIHERTVAAWTARNKPGNDQGVDYKEIPLDSRILKKLTFKVSGHSSYWRAGFKLVAPNASESMPKLFTDKSFLFHIGKNEDGEFGLSVYHDGKQESATHKIIPLEEAGEITLTIERGEKNYVKCFVGDSLEYNKGFNPELFKKAFFVAWGDGHDYEVIFDDIAYEVE